MHLPDIHSNDDPADKHIPLNRCMWYYDKYSSYQYSQHLNPEELLLVKDSLTHFYLITKNSNNKYPAKILEEELNECINQLVDK